jgi:hypothetical protein
VQRPRPMLINSSIRASDEATTIALPNIGRPTRQFPPRPPQSRPKLAFTMMNRLSIEVHAGLTLGHFCRNFSASIGRILHAREFWCDRNNREGEEFSGLVVFGHYLCCHCCPFIFSATATASHSIEHPTDEICHSTHLDSLRFFNQLYYALLMFQTCQCFHAPNLFDLLSFSNFCINHSEFSVQICRFI